MPVAVLADTGGDDHGDDRSSATVVALPSETAGRIEPGSDVDYFRFEVSETREVTIETTGGWDTVGTLEDGEGGELASDDDAGSGNNFRIQRSLSAGTYYVRVGSYDSSTAAYTLRLTAEADDSEDEGDGDGGGDDHGDDRSSATVVALPSETAGRIEPGSDVDYFRFEVSETREVTIGTTGGLDTVGRLEDSEGGRLASNDDSDSGTNFRIQRSLPAGTYYVRVGSYGSSTGAYTLALTAEGEGDGDGDGHDHGDDRSSATVVTLPSETAGRIDPGSDVDYFRFEVSETSEVIIETTGDLGPDLTLEYDNGRVTPSQWRIRRSLSAGTYYVRVESDDSATTGAYTLRLAVVGADDHGDDRSTATPVALPSNTEGGIDHYTDVDYFQFEVSETREVTIATTGDVNMVGTLEDGEGGELASNERFHGNNFSITRSLSAGTYYVRVASLNWGTRTGAYTLWLKGADDHGDARSSATEVELPSETAGRIEPGTDVDYFRFEVSETREVAIYTAGSLETHQTLHDAEGDALAGGGNLGIGRSLPAGTYYVRVRSSLNGSTGAYTLRLLVVGADDHGDVRSSATPVALPSEIGGVMDHHRDVDYFRFEVSETREVTVSTPRNADVNVTLEDSEGVQLERNFVRDGANDRTPWRSLSPGTYYVRVEIWPSLSLGAYTLQLTVAADDDHGDDRSSATLVTLQSETAGRIEPDTDVDYFRFEVAETTTVTIDTTGDVDTVGTLEDGEGGELRSTGYHPHGDGFSIQQSLSAGTYYVRVASRGFHTGAYTLRLWEHGTDDHGDDRSSATLVALPSETAGQIDHYNDVDYFRFEVPGTREVSFDATGAASRYVDLEDSEGNPIGITISQRILSAGTYYLRVEPREPSGAYTLRLAVLRGGDDHGDWASSATPVAVPSETAGRIEPGDDKDWFRFELSEPRDVTIRTTGASAGLATSGELEDSEGRRLASDSGGHNVDNNFSITRSLSDGTYYVRVSSGGGGTGTYSLLLRVADDHGDDRSSATLVALPSETEGQIEHGTDVDYFRFELSEPRTVTVGTPGSNFTWVTLEDELEELERNTVQDGANWRTRGRSLSEGTYYVRVRSDGSATGAYTLRLAVGEDDDHGDERSSATLVALPSETEGRFEEGDDVDYFRFELSETREVTIETTGGLDTVGRLEDSEGDRLASNDDGGSGTNFRIQRSLSAGTYYVRVGSDASRAGAYTLRLAVGEDDDHGDERSSATLVALPSETVGRLHSATDVDYFRFVLSEPREVGTNLKNSDEALQLTLEDGEGDSVGVGGDHRDLSAGTYYVRVAFDDRYEYSGPYTYVLLLTDAGVPHDYDQHGNERSSATLVALPSETGGRIEPGTDVDYFRFELSETRDVTIATTAPDLDTHGTLEDSEGVELASDDDRGERLNFSIRRSLSAGTYYVRVRRVDGFGPYTLLLTADDHGDERSSATPVALPSVTGGRITGQDGLSGSHADVDYFRFEVAETREVEIRTTGNLDSAGTLFDGEGVALGQSAAWGRHDFNFRIRRTLSAGTYYVSVSGQRDGGAGVDMGPYTLRLAVVGDDDHGDERWSATRVALPSETGGRIEHNTDVDYFRFEVSEPREVTIETTGDLDTAGVLEDSEGRGLAADADSGSGPADRRHGTNFRIRRSLSPGTYYVRVKSYAFRPHYWEDAADCHLREYSCNRHTIDSELGAYTLRLTEHGDGADDHGDARSSATRVALPSETGGRIEPGTDVDYFRFELSEPREVTIATTGDLDTAGTLEDSEGRELAANDGGGSGANFSIRRRLSPGTYYVRIGTNGSATGAYTLRLVEHGDGADDHGDERSSATWVALPSQTAGRIEPGTDVDYFRFEVSHTRRVTIATSGNLDTVGTLEDSDGGELAWNDDDGGGVNFSIRRSLSAGTYYVRVRSHGASTGAYTLRLAAVGADDHGDDRSSATPVALPSETGERSETRGRIEHGADVDYFRFEVFEPRDVAIGTFGSVDTAGTLEDSDGGELASDDDGGSGPNFRIRRTLLAGTYYIRVGTGAGRYISDRIGAYRLWLLDHGRADDHGDELSSATPVALPSETPGWMGSRNDVDYFRFEVSEPREVTIETTLNAYWDAWTEGWLYDSVGRELARPTRDNDIRRSLWAGTYYVRVRPDGWRRPGAYTLRLAVPVDAEDDHGGALSSATVMALPSETAGRIEHGTDVDYFRFEVSERRTVTVGTPGNGFTWVTLEDSAGVELERNTVRDGADWRTRRRSLSAGTYYVRVRSDGSATGAYLLRLTDHGDADDHGDEPSSATLVALPSETAGQIEPGADVDYFRFEVSEPREVTIATTGGLDTAGTLEDSEGGELASDDDGGGGANFRIRRSLAAGTYHVRVESDGSATGAYAMRLMHSGDDGGVGDHHGDDRSSATPVALPSETGGWIDHGADVDYFRFEVSETRWVAIETTGDLYTVGTLEDSEGGELASNQTSGSGRNFSIRRSLSAGTYYVRVRSHGASTGAYTLRLAAVGADDHGDERSSATPVALPAEIDGWIDHVDDVDYFRFEVSETRWVAFETTGDLYTAGTLEDSEGGEVSLHNGGVSLSAGTYYVAIRWTGVTGAYALRLRVASDDEEPFFERLVAVPSETRGWIYPGYEEEHFVFEVSETTDVTVETTGGLDTVGELTGWGYPQTDDDSGSGYNFRIRRNLPAGRYSVDVGSYEFDTGPYTLRLTGETVADDHGEVRSSATLVALPSLTEGRFEHDTDVDYFRFEVFEGNWVAIVYNGPVDNTEVTLYDSEGSSLAEATDFPSTLYIFPLRLSEGSYYVRVESLRSPRPSTDAYTLRLWVGEDDHGDDRSSATPVALPSVTAGYIHIDRLGYSYQTSPTNFGDQGDIVTDVDYFRFEVAETRVVTIETTGYTDTVGTLEDGEGRRLAYNHDHGRRPNHERNPNFAIRYELSAGTYYVRVETPRDPRTNEGESGPYQLRLSTTTALRPTAHDDDGGGVGNDHGDERASATLVALPSETGGRIDPGNDVDYFRFELTATRWVAIETTGSLDMAGTLEEGEVTAARPNAWRRDKETWGTALAADDDGGSGHNFRIRRSLSAGTYYVRVESRGSLTGAYTLRLTVVGDDDHGDEPSAATPVALPSNPGGWIDRHADVDYFRFEVSGTREVAITTTYGGNLHHEDGLAVTLEDSEGGHLAGNSSYSLSAGTYYVRVETSRFLYATDQRDYNLQLLVLGDEVDEHGDERSSATSVAETSRTVGRIEPLGDDVDYYRFEVAETRWMIIETVAPDNAWLYSPRRLERFWTTSGSLYDSEGNHLASGIRDNVVGFRIQYKVTAGTYYVRVSGSGSKTPIYTLRLRAETDDAGEVISSATPVALPSETGGRFEVSWLGSTRGVNRRDSDMFRFEVSDTRVVSIETTTVPVREIGSLKINGELFRSDGGRLADFAADFGGGIRRELLPGTYHVRVSPEREELCCENRFRNVYALRLTTESHDGAVADDHGDVRSSATLVALPSETGGRIEPGNDVDYFRFEVSDTRKVTIETTGGLDTLGSLEDSEGEPLASHDDGGSGANFRIGRSLSAGTYYLRVRSYGRATGTYTLRLMIAGDDDDHGDTRSSATLVALPSETRGWIESSGDVDYFQFEVSETRWVTIEADGSPMGGWVENSAGQPLASLSNYGNVWVTNLRIWIKVPTGTYYVRLRGSGTYMLRLTVVADDDHGDDRSAATQVALPSKTRGWIERSGDVDYFRFEVPETQEVDIVAWEKWTLEDSAGGELASSSDYYDDRERRSLSAGTYYLRVESHGSETGAYQLWLTGVGSDDHGDDRLSATALAVPSETTGWIEHPTDRDHFVFQVPEDKEVTIWHAGGIQVHSDCVHSPCRYGAGTHNINVTTDRTDPGRHSYMLRLTVEGDDGGVADDHGDAGVALPSQTAGRVDSGSDAGYVQFDGSKTREVAIGTTGRWGLFGLTDKGVQSSATSRMPLFPAADVTVGRQGFLRVANRNGRPGEARVRATDDGGHRVGPVALALDGSATVHLNSGDWEQGNAAKGLPVGVGTPTRGDWRLALASDLDIQVASYIRHSDGFVTTMHELVPWSEANSSAGVAFFNPASGTQKSLLRLINDGAEAANVAIAGVDDAGQLGSEARLIVPAGEAVTISADELENGGGLLEGALGDGSGKWRLTVTADRRIGVMSLLESPWGHLANLSSVPRAEADGTWRMPLFPAARDAVGRQGFLRVANRDGRGGEVRLWATDDSGHRVGPVALALDGSATVHLNSGDLEQGNAGKGLPVGVGAPTRGDWRLALASDLDIQVASYIRHSDGFVTTMHALALWSVADSAARVVFFNPASNRNQESLLRLINDGAMAANVVITGLDDAGQPGGEARLTVPAGEAVTISADELEDGGGLLEGALGDGSGKWRLTVTADRPVGVMSLLESPTGHLSNLSSAGDGG